MLLNAFAYRHAHAMTHFAIGGNRTRLPEVLTRWEKLGVLFTGVSLPRPETTSPATTLGAATSPLTIPCANGIRLGAWYHPGDRSKPLSICFHGYGGEKSGTLPEAEVFSSLGFSALLVDFRGSGGSSEAYTTIGFREAEDVTAAVQYARRELQHSKIYLYGQSMGAAAILRAIDTGGVKADAVILEAVFDRMLTTVRHRFELMGLPAFPGAELLVLWGGWQFGFNGFAHNPVRYAARVECPILFLHGGVDPRARIDEARRVFAAVPGAKQFHEFRDARHEATVLRHPAEWRAVVGRFLEGVETGAIR